jgi:K+-sensing histidine kinase KdpD
MQKSISDRGVLLNSSLLLSHVLAAISHELRSPLAAIKGSTTTLLDYQSRLEPEKVAAFLDAIDRETDRLSEMLDDLIALARSQIGVLRLQRATLPLAEVLAPLVMDQVCQVVDQTIDTEPPAVWLDVDVRRVQQALTYLVQPLRVDLPVETRIPIFVSVSSQRVVVRLGEAGALVALDRSAHLLEQTEYLDNPVLRRSAHAVLRLLLSRAVLELHGGQLWFEDQPTMVSACVSLPCVQLVEVE